jgi:hypothetical protein
MRQPLVATESQQFAPKQFSFGSDRVQVARYQTTNGWIRRAATGRLGSAVSESGRLKFSRNHQINTHENETRR